MNETAKELEQNIRGKQKIFILLLESSNRQDIKL